jgi:hypothetical protein
MNQSNHEQAMVSVLDVLLEHDGLWSHRPGETLSLLSQRIFGPDAVVGSNEYHRISLAVLDLERIGLVRVDRVHRREAHKANLIRRIILL